MKREEIGEVHEGDVVRLVFMHLGRVLGETTTIDVELFGAVGGASRDGIRFNAQDYFFHPGSKKTLSERYRKKVETWRGMEVPYERIKSIQVLDSPRLRPKPAF
jgi:hypothetical protein